MGIVQSVVRSIFVNDDVGNFVYEDEFAKKVKDNLK